MKEMMKIKVFLLAVFLLLVSSINASENEQDPKEVIKKVSEAFQSGNAEQLSKNFYKTIELELLGDENFYSQAQAFQLMKSFFEKYKPVKFTINHQGVKDLSAFAIGTLQSKSAIFRVSIFLKTENGKSYIHQLRVENDDENTSD